MTPKSPASAFLLPHLVHHKRGPAWRVLGKKGKYFRCKILCAEMKEIFDRRQIGARTEAELKRMHLTKMDNMRK